MVSVAELTAESIPAPAAKPKRARKPRAKAAEAKPEAPAPASGAAPWAMAGVAITLVLSASLNGLTYSRHAEAAWAGWMLGVAVPTLVLLLSRVAGLQYRAGRRPVAWAAAGSGVSLLVLSIVHCAEAISLLTGSGFALSVPLALAIDAGLVSFELSLISEGVRS